MADIIDKLELLRARWNKNGVNYGIVDEAIKTIEALKAASPNVTSITIRDRLIPLTLREAALTEYCIIEFRACTDSMMKIRSGCSVCRVFNYYQDCHSVSLHLLGDSESYAYNSRSYGVTWRCWAAMPTQQEINEAKWEDDSSC